MLPLASLAVRRSPLARAAKNGQFWPVFGPFWPVFGLFLHCAVTVESGAKRQPSQHPGTPRVAQGWMGLSYSRDGAASRFARCPPLAARSRSQKWPVLSRFWAVLACFWAVLASRGDRRERSKMSAISAPWNPPGCHERSSRTRNNFVQRTVRRSHPHVQLLNSMFSHGFGSFCL